jgi:outer membrane protein assembly factor BamB
MTTDESRVRRVILALAAALALGACDDLLVPMRDPTAAADLAFGASRVEWFVPDPVGGWTMQPALTATHVYFERDAEITPAGTVVKRAQLVALDRATGAPSWAQTMGTAENAAVAGDVIGAVWGSLPMFDRVTGAPLPVFRYGETSLSGNVVSDGERFYVLTHDGHALAVSPRSGAADWDVDLARPGSATGFGVALEGDALAVTLKHFGHATTARDSGIVAVLDRATGAVRWRAEVGGGHDPGITDPPVITAGLVVARTGGHDVRAWDLGTGALRWRVDARRTAANYGSSGLAACDGMVIATTAELGIVALDARTGAVRWQARSDDLGSLSTLECSYGTVLARGSGLAVYDARTGERRARYPIRDPDDGRRQFMIASVTRDAEFLYISTTYGYAKVRAPGR